MAKKYSIKKFLLEIPEEIWEKWKETVPRAISLNEALIEMIKREGKNLPLSKRGQRRGSKK